MPLSEPTMSIPPAGNKESGAGERDQAQAANKTPEGASTGRLLQHVSHPIATIGQRFWALIIDLVLVSVVTFIIWVVLGLITFRFGSLEVYEVGTLVLSILYFILFESMDGQTIGKKILHIRVVSAETMKKPGLEAVIIRNVLRVLDAFPPNFYIIGFLFAILNDRRQRAGDMLAKTLVVQEAEKIL